MESVGLNCSDQYRNGKNPNLRSQPPESLLYIGLMIVLQFILAPYSSLINFLMTMLSRRYEFQVKQIIVSLSVGSVVPILQCTQPVKYRYLKT